MSEELLSPPLHQEIRFLPLLKPTLQQYIFVVVYIEEKLLGFFCFFSFGKKFAQFAEYVFVGVGVFFQTKELWQLFKQTFR